MRVVLSRRAEADLAEITDYIALDSPTRAESFEDELLAQSRKIGLSPLAYVARPELGHGIRSCAYGRYGLFFSVREDAVVIERILHGSRDILGIFQP
jgi:toxin ParE1/3/4